MTKKEINILIDNILNNYMAESVYLPKEDKLYLIDFIYKKSDKKIISNFIAEYLYENLMVNQSFNLIPKNNYIINTINGYRHKIDLSHYKSEIKYYFDKNANGIYLNWSNQNGMPIDIVAEELKEQGINLTSNNPIDKFVEMLEIYENAKGKKIDNRLKLKSCSEISREDFLEYVKTSFTEELNKMEKCF